MISERIVSLGSALFRAWELIKLGDDKDIKHKRKPLGLGEAKIDDAIRHLGNEYKELCSYTDDLNLFEESCDMMSILLHIALKQGRTPEEVFDTVTKKLLYRYEFEGTIGRLLDMHNEVALTDRDKEWYERYYYLHSSYNLIQCQKEAGFWEAGK